MSPLDIRATAVLAAGVGLAYLLGRLIAPRRIQASKTRLRRVQARVEIAARPQQVFAIIVDPCKPFITSNPFVRMELGSDQMAGVGTIYRWSYGLPRGPRLGFEEVVTEWEEGRKMAYRAISGWDMHATGELAPTAGGTAYTFTLEYRPPRPWDFLIPHWLETLIIRGVLTNVKRHAEAEGELPNSASHEPEGVLENDSDIASVSQG